jgi:uncharacterized membrane protein
MIRWPVPVVAVLALAVLAVCWLFYRRAVAGFPTRRRALILALRALSALLLVMFLFRPVLSYPSSSGEMEILILADTSESMGISDTIGASEGKTRLDAAKEIAAGKNGVAGGMPSGSHVALGAFDSDAEICDADTFLKAEAAGKSTDPAYALEKLLKRGNPSALVILTDGCFDPGSDPGKILLERHVPTYVVGVGADLSAKPGFKDLAIASLKGGPTVFVKVAEEIEAVVAARGLSDAELAAPFSVTLSDTNGVIERKQVKIEGTPRTGRAAFKITPEREGFYHYIVKIEPVTGEKILQNNSREITLYATSARIRALLIEGTNRWEGKFLSSFLKRDPNVEFTGLFNWGGKNVTRQGAPGPWKGEDAAITPESLASFDVVILGDVPAESFTEESLAALRGFIAEKGGGFVATGGYKTFGAGGYGATALAAAFPVDLTDNSDAQFEKEFRPAVTPAGRAHPVFGGYADFFAENDSRLAPLDGATRMGRSKPGAEVLLKFGDMPILAVQNFGKGRVAAFAADTTWRWFLQMKAMGENSPYERFWGQLARWVSHRGDESAVPGANISVRADSRVYKVGGRVAIEARIAENAPASARPKAALAGPGGVKQMLSLSPAGERLWTASARAETPGEWTVSASIEGEGFTALYSYEVSGDSREFDEIGLNDSALSALAERTGGKYYNVLEAAKIPEDVEKRFISSARIVQKDVFGSPVFFLAFLACITLEWILRKRNNLV